MIERLTLNMAPKLNREVEEFLQSASISELQLIAKHYKIVDIVSDRVGLLKAVYDAINKSVKLKSEQSFRTLEAECNASGASVGQDRRHTAVNLFLLDYGRWKESRRKSDLSEIQKIKEENEKKDHKKLVDQFEKSVSSSRTRFLNEWKTRIEAEEKKNLQAKQEQVRLQ